uniref:Secreted protein n=1 Tax=Thermoanaerobaculum aquaticum TaxID=1312852 RepID=A0A7V1ZH52_9BACT
MGWLARLVCSFLLLAPVVPAVADSVYFTTTSGSCTTETCLHADRIEFVVDGDGELRIRLIGYRGKVTITYC